jgi:hypothetical protein
MDLEQFHTLVLHLAGWCGHAVSGNNAAMYLKSTGLALVSAIIAAVAWETGNFVYGRVSVARLASGDNGSRGIGAVSFPSADCRVVAFVGVFWLTSRRLRL